MAIHVAITRRVRPGCETGFQEALRDFLQASLSENGILGVHMVVPPPGSDARDYGILRTFADSADRDAFYRSPLYEAWLGRVAPLTEGDPTIRELTGLEAWFRTERPLPPRWKMAVATMIGVYPTSLALSLTVGRAVRGWPILAAGLAMTVSMVVLLTWVVMPLVTRGLHGWLHASERRRSP